MKFSGRTRELLAMHGQAYPQLQIQDVFKFLYQSAFGCEHMALPLQQAEDLIRQEYVQAKGNTQALAEPLDGPYSRVHLGYLDYGMSVETFAKLFLASAKKEEDAVKVLEEKLQAAQALAKENAFSFSALELEQEAAAWQANGYSPVRHSTAFRAAYAPHYRVIAEQYVPYLPLFAKLDTLLKTGSKVVAIEGGSASGKTTLAGVLQELYDCTVFHMDDFFLRPGQRTKERYEEVGGNVDRERFLEEVLLPLKKGRPIHYRRFDCASFRLGEAVTVIPQKLVVIEGAYSMHPDLAGYYDCSVFLHVNKALQKERISKRNSPEFAKRFHEEWIPMEERYFCEMRVKDRCDLLLSIG